VQLGPVDPEQYHMFDINGGLLPIVGSVKLTVRIGSYDTEVTFGVVPRMSVPVLLGTDYTDIHVPVISGPSRFIRLLNGDKVPILGRGKSVTPPAPKVEAAAHTAEPADACVRLAKGVVCALGQQVTYSLPRPLRETALSPPMTACTINTRSKSRLAP